MPLNPRLVRAKNILERRVFLKALGLGMAAPLAFKLARTATAQSVGAPKRFFLMFMPHGIPPEHYNPRAGSSPSDFRLNDTNVSILGPLEQYKQYVNVYEGFQYTGEAATHDGIVNCLTGYSGADTTSARTSIETVIAKGLGTKATILGACSHLPYGLDKNGMLFWDGKAIDPEKNPAKAADSLFANLGGGGAPAPSPGPVNAEVEIRNELLKLNIGEIESLKSELNGLTSEQTKLDSHLTAVQALLSGGSGGPGPGQQLSCTTKPTLPTVEKVRAESAGQVVDSSGGNDYFYQEKNFPLIFEAQLELIAQALICNASQVMALMPMYATCDFDFGFAKAPGSHHNTLSHTTPGTKGQWDSPVSVDNFLPETRQGFAKAQLWFSEMLVNKVVKLLAETDDPAGEPGSKVLDNTLIYWMSEIGDGANHTRTSYVEHPQVPQSLPLVTIGKCGGAIKSGQFIQFPLAPKPEGADAVNRPAADLYLTMAQAMGVSNASIPGANKVVSEVLS
jgi:Protein of unknown function (DUF1552)